MAKKLAKGMHAFVDGPSSAEGSKQGMQYEPGPGSTEGFGDDGLDDPPAGEKGNRACLPTSSIMIRQPLGMTRGQATNLDLGRHEIRITTSHVIETLATHTGKAQEQIAADIARPRYMDAQGAVDYGIVDTILSEKKEQIEARGLA